MNVDVDLSSIEKMASSLETTINTIQETEQKLNENYKKLAGEWSDAKYRELGSIVNECQRSLKKAKEEFKKAYNKLLLIVQHLMEYENTDLIADTGSFGFNGSRFSSWFRGGRSNNIQSSLRGVEYRPITPATSARTEQEIISSISGGDLTEGSCSSLALAYAGNRAGYVVYDFRDGQSREVFSSRSSIEQIANMNGVNSVIERGADDTICAERLMSTMEPGREYYMATGAHAAVVRLDNEGHYQYLELQSGTPSENGWQPLTLNALYSRFGCEDGQSREYSNYLIELDSLQSNSEFLDILGYINTDESAQVRGADGYVR